MTASLLSLLVVMELGRLEAWRLGRFARRYRREFPMN